MEERRILSNSLEAREDEESRHRKAGWEDLGCQVGATVRDSADEPGIAAHVGLRSVFLGPKEEGQEGPFLHSASWKEGLSRTPELSSEAGRM